MAISKERLEELIKEGAFIFYIYNEKSIGIIKLDKSYGISVDKYNEINKCKPVFYHKGNVYQDICDANKIFETKEEAQWHLDFTAERVEKLELPMWEEIYSSDFDMSFIDTKKIKHQIWVTTDGICVTNPVLDDKNKYWGYSKENYIEACKLCLKLFKGEE